MPHLLYCTHGSFAKICFAKLSFHKNLVTPVYSTNCTVFIHSTQFNYWFVDNKAISNPRMKPLSLKQLQNFQYSLKPIYKICSVRQKFRCAHSQSQSASFICALHVYTSTSTSLGCTCSKLRCTIMFIGEIFSYKLCIAQQYFSCLDANVLALVLARVHKVQREYLTALCGQCQLCVDVWL